MNKNEIVMFETEDRSVTLPVAVEHDTVWLSANQILEEEVNKDNNTQKMRVDGVKQSVPFYTLDVIISVGYSMFKNDILNDNHS